MAGGVSAHSDKKLLLICAVIWTKTSPDRYIGPLTRRGIYFSQWMDMFLHLKFGDLSNILLPLLYRAPSQASQRTWPNFTFVGNVCKFSISCCLHCTTLCRLPEGVTYHFVLFIIKGVVSRLIIIWLSQLFGLHESCWHLSSRFIFDLYSQIDKDTV